MSMHDGGSTKGPQLRPGQQFARPPPGDPPGPPLRRQRAAARNAPDDRRDPQMGVCDVTQLLSLTEESVMQNTMVRFSRDEIYTYVGSVLLAVNPYKPIPSLYGEAAMAAVETSSLIDAPPHIYALAEGAYRRAIRGGGGPQSLIISGESGAGKTESTKLALSYLVWRARRRGRAAGAAARGAARARRPRPAAGGAGVGADDVDHPGEPAARGVWQRVHLAQHQLVALRQVHPPRRRPRHRRARRRPGSHLPPRKVARGRL